MAARFFVDENDLALGKALADRYGNVVYPGHPELPEVPRQTIDDVWLRIVSLKRLVVITRDQRIRYRPVEKRRWVDDRVRGFVLTGKTSQSTSDSLALLERHWEHMAATVEASPDRGCTPSDLRVLFVGVAPRLTVRTLGHTSSRCNLMLFGQGCSRFLTAFSAPRVYGRARSIRNCGGFMSWASTLCTRPK